MTAAVDSTQTPVPPPSTLQDPQTWNADLFTTIFGEVVFGYEVIEKIELSKTDGDDRPEEDKKIVKASIKET